MNSTAPSSSTPDLLTRAQATQWLQEAIDSPMPQTAALSLQLAQTIELLHHISFSLPAPTRLTNPLILNAFRLLTHGDTSISPYDLFPHINAALRRRDPDFLGQPLLWHSLQVAAWLKNFRNPRRPNKTLTKQDLTKQAQLLLQTDLTPHLPNPSLLLTHLPSYL